MAYSRIGAPFLQARPLTTPFPSDQMGMRKGSSIVGRPPLLYAVTSRTHL